MKQVVWKFPLAFADRQTLGVPVAGFTPLKVDTQFGRPYLWALVNPDAAVGTRTVFIRGTGQVTETEKPLTRRDYIDTFTTESGELVFHVFMQNMES